MIEGEIVARPAILAGETVTQENVEPRERGMRRGFDESFKRYHARQLHFQARAAHRAIVIGDDIDPFDFIRMLAVARILMPQSHVRLSAGREAMNEQMQALAFFAGANSIFYGDKLLTTANPQADKDMQLFSRLGILPEAREEHADEVHQAAIEQALVEQKSSEQFYNAAV